jgi:hypothetical protein
MLPAAASTVVNLSDSGQNDVKDRQVGRTAAALIVSVLVVVALGIALLRPTTEISVGHDSDRGTALTIPVTADKKELVRTLMLACDGEVRDD